MLANFDACSAEPLADWVSGERHDKMAKNYLNLVEPCRSPCYRHYIVDLEEHNHYSSVEAIHAERWVDDTFVAGTLIAGALTALAVGALTAGKLLVAE